MYKEPKWVKSIPKSSAHGTGDLQKRLWRVVSDYVRIRDWYKYGGCCVATGVYIPHWSEGQAGHFKAYAVCNGMFKFDERNIHLQTANSNYFGDKKGDKAQGYYFGEELKKRYGKNFIEELEKENRKHISEKMDNTIVLDKIIYILELMKSLPEQPDYFDRVESKRYEHLG